MLLARPAPRLYTKQKEGGRGLVSVRASFQDETDEISEYLRMMAPRDEVLSECLRLQKPDGEEQLENLMGKQAPAHHAQPPPRGNGTPGMIRGAGGSKKPLRQSSR